MRTAYTHLITIIRAPNDRNGNPRLGYLVSSTESGQPIEIIEDDYRGTEAVAHRYPDAVHGFLVNVTVSEYRRLCRRYPEMTF